MPPIDWSNPTVQGAWLAAVIALAGVVVAGLAGFLGAVVGAGIGSRAARHAADVSRQQAEADRADAAQARREARTDARLARFADQRRELYTALWIACDRHKREVEAQVSWRRAISSGRGGQDPGIGPSEPARQAFLAVTLLAGYDVIAAAERLYDATTALGRQHAYIAIEGQQVPPPNERQWLADLNAWNEAAAHFESEAGADLRAQ